MTPEKKGMRSCEKAPGNSRKLKVLEKCLTVKSGARMLPFDSQLQCSRLLEPARKPKNSLKMSGGLAG